MKLAPLSCGLRPCNQRLANHFASLSPAAHCWFLACLWTACSGKDAKAADAKKRGNQPIPVTVATAKVQDMPVYLNGLGSVTAFNTVSVKSRIDGQLTEVAFKEGQHVNKGDLLAVIDPRPYEVALSQAQAALFRDQAQLKDAKLNYERFKDLLQNSGAVSQQQVDTQQATVDQFEGTDPHRSSGHRQRQAATELLPHHLPGKWTRRPAPGRRRQHGARIRYAAAAGDHQAATHRSAVHHSRGQPALGGATHAQRHVEGGRLQPRRSNQARLRNAADHRQPDRPDNRHRKAEGGFRQPRQFSVAQPVRECPFASGSPKEHPGDSRCGGAARTARHLRFHRETGQESGSAASHGCAYAE